MKVKQISNVQLRLMMRNIDIYNLIMNYWPIIIELVCQLNYDKIIQLGF